MSKLTYVSKGGHFTVSIDDAVAKKIQQYCLDSRNLETGGVLVGEYDNEHRRAKITYASGPPHGSKHGFSSFFRAVGRLQDWIDDLWSRRKGYYLGEWHYHPKGSPEPSGIDRSQLKSIAADSGYACPEPILVILGGDPEKNWSLSVSVFTKDSSLRLERA